MYKGRMAANIMVSFIVKICQDGNELCGRKADRYSDCGGEFNN